MVLTTGDHESAAMESLAMGAQDYPAKMQLDGSDLRRAILRAIQRNDAQIERCGTCHIRLDKFCHLPLSEATADVSLFDRQLRLLRDLPAGDAADCAEPLSSRDPQLFSRLVARCQALVEKDPRSPTVKRQSLPAAKMG